jgi:hypothetical protein
MKGRQTCGIYQWREGVEPDINDRKVWSSFLILIPPRITLRRAARSNSIFSDDVCILKSTTCSCDCTLLYTVQAHPVGPHRHQPGANNDGDGGRHVREARHPPARGETRTVIFARNFVNTSYITK